MNGQKMRTAIDKVFKELFNMDEEDLKRLIEEHKTGDIAEILLETGAFDNENYNSRIENNN